MKLKLFPKETSKIPFRFGAFACLLLATGVAVWLRKSTVALPLLLAATLMALATLNAVYEGVMLD